MSKRNKLTEDQYEIAINKGTEMPFSGKYNNEKRKGVYNCVVCNSPLFDSITKYDSGTGWPAFYAPYAENSVNNHEDSSHGMQRIEVRCRVCDSHLGHVFNDGPAPTGLRYCINSLVLNFIEDC
ncbi:MAG: peptide-methionine (R)-S-oxide reductase [Pelagibacterales bacterium]|mgnify:FL=1|nr:peptide-methionine (R)-S-oxide reductase [Pelagibacterales bacterium]|tara:strand:+ start:3862 stop:4233 length:372 start_codon:yes stop_codon:yes gene_type:complete